MPISRSTRAVVGLTTLVTTLLAVLVLGTGVASAHDRVVASDPAANAELAAPPARVSITMSAVPQGQLSTLTVVGPDGQRYEQGATTTADRVVSVAVNPLGPAGRYEIGYRVVSSDGHPVTGAIAVSLTAPGPAAAPPAASAAGPASPAAPGAPGAQPGSAEPSPAAGQSPAANDESGVPAWPFVVLVVLVVGGAVALALRRRSS